MMTPQGREPPRETYDCVVVGAGPAGSSTARELARRGASVLMVDRSSFPRSKVCGCCLNPRALKTLDRIGLGDLPARLRAIPLRGIELASAGRKVRFRHRLGVALSRDAMDLALANEAVDVGVSFFPSTRAELIPLDSELRPESSMREVRLRVADGERVVRARAVVSATGLADTFHDATPEHQPGSKIGAGVVAPCAPNGYEPGLIYMACGEDGYVGLVVLEDGRLDLAAALRPEAVKASGGIGSLAKTIVEDSGLAEVPGIASLPWKGTPHLTRTSPVIAGDGVYRVGDSAGYVEPFTGEGMAWALAGGARLGEILAASFGQSNSRTAQDWRKAYLREVVQRQLVCRLASVTLRTPWITRTFLRLVGVAPGLARPLLRAMHRA